MATSAKTVAAKLLVKPGSTVHLPADPDAIRERVEQPDVGWTTVAIAAVDAAWSALRVKPSDADSFRETRDALASAAEMDGIR